MLAESYLPAGASTVRPWLSNCRRAANFCPFGERKPRISRVWPCLMSPHLRLGQRLSADLLPDDEVAALPKAITAIATPARPFPPCVNWGECMTQRTVINKLRRVVPLSLPTGSGNTRWMRTCAPAWIVDTNVITTTTPNSLPTSVPFLLCPKS